MKNSHFLSLRLMSALMVYKEELPSIGEMNRWDGCHEKAWAASKIRNALIGG
ncbi:MAG TPA: hypothetical protein PLL53_06005 [Saprospiraceae bacterium]|nr:hypothetical protein [Saprospiraceae bacterium]